MAAPVSSESVVRILPLAGCLLALVSTLLPARYVVLDVQGLIEHPALVAKPTVAATPQRSVDDATAETDESVTTWTDGSDLDHDYSDDDRPLSKAERKRLRKQHGRYRAA